MNAHSPTPGRASPHHRYSGRVLAHLDSPRGVGPLAEATGTGAAGSVSCGDLVHIQLRLEGRRIAAARFQAYGCPATIAGASELVERVEGADLLDAAAISEESIAQVLQLSPQKRACSNIAVDALHQALEDALRGIDAAPADPKVTLDPRGVVVGMSGGVDSTVAALELVRQGYRVIGVTFRLWSDPVCATGRSCCSPEAIVAARRAAHGLGLPHLTIDLSERFCTEVVDYFVDEYGRARTPNPCVRCNAVLRFGALAAVADSLGAAWIATGHYARLTGEPPQLTRGVDDHKDQSYVLAQVPPTLLRRARFPLGGLHKTQTRALARQEGLEVHDNPDSQEICFIPDDDYRRFLRARVQAPAGDIIDTEGRVRGRHAGLHNYTIGQRRGLGITDPQPLYVVSLRLETHQVVVGSAAATEVHEVRVSGVVRHGADSATLGPLTAQVRSTGGAVGVECRPKGDGLVLRLGEAVRGVAPGQTAVVYAGNRVLFAGTIDDTA